MTTVSKDSYILRPPSLLCLPYVAINNGYQFPFGTAEGDESKLESAGLTRRAAQGAPGGVLVRRRRWCRALHLAAHAPDRSVAARSCAHAAA